jgi:hypothetical protein
MCWRRAVRPFDSKRPSRLTVLCQATPDRLPTWATAAGRAAAGPAAAGTPGPCRPHEGGAELIPTIRQEQPFPTIRYTLVDAHRLCLIAWALHRRGQAVGPCCHLGESTSQRGSVACRCLTAKRIPLGRQGREGSGVWEHRWPPGRRARHANLARCLAGFVKDSSGLQHCQSGQQHEPQPRQTALTSLADLMPEKGLYRVPDATALLERHAEARYPPASLPD